MLPQQEHLLSVGGEQLKPRREFMNTVRIAAVGLALGMFGFMAVPVSAEDYTAVMQRDIKWQDAPSIGPGAKTALIDGDPKSSGLFVMRLKLPAKTTIKLHT
ncbi:MAG: hypothetical protein EPO27_17210, partial [Betaproteobacteria bacterium]